MGILSSSTVIHSSVSIYRCQGINPNFSSSLDRFITLPLPTDREWNVPQTSPNSTSRLLVFFSSLPQLPTLDSTLVPLRREQTRIPIPRRNCVIHSFDNTDQHADQIAFAEKTGGRRGSTRLGSCCCVNRTDRRRRHWPVLPPLSRGPANHDPSLFCLCRPHCRGPRNQGQEIGPSNQAKSVSESLRGSLGAPKPRRHQPRPPKPNPTACSLFLNTYNSHWRLLPESRPRHKRRLFA